MRPFLITSAQAGKLPRWGLLLLIALYVLPGLFGRDPWATQDAAGFGIAHTMATGSVSDWLMPNVAGAPVAEEGPLPFALGAVAIRVASVIVPGPQHVAHIATGMVGASGLVLLLSLFWYATYELAWRPSFQPHDPLGAAASRTDLARAIADSSLLVLIATVGMVTRAHETTAEAAQLVWSCAFLFGVARSLERPRRGALCAAAAVAATATTSGLVPAALLMSAWLALPLISQPFRLVARPLLTLGLPVAIAGALVWPALLWFGDEHSRAFLQTWLAWNTQQYGWPKAQALGYLLRTGPWYFWPAWPLAAWAGWRWRGRLGEPALALPLMVAAVFLIAASLLQSPGETGLLPALPAIAMVAAAGLPTLRRRLVNLIDWFAVIVWTFFGFAVWAYWLAYLSGLPPRMAFRASHIVPGYALEVSWLELGLAVAATLAWLALVRWRISRRPPMIWRAVVLSAGGLVLSWFLAMTLWLPVFNERNTYRGIAGQLAHAVPLGSQCVAADGLGLAERASLAYFADVRFAATGGGNSCDWRLIQDQGPVARAVPYPEPGWNLAWEGRRRPNLDERFRLYQRSGK
ncbi:MAG: glycosyltransferase [Burkholderiaceae bacterium]|nr:glycosyltransferase [Burkholderiaceae bacterium]